jgi:hypothetical protein
MSWSLVAREVCVPFSYEATIAQVDETSLQYMNVTYHSNLLDETKTGIGLMIAKGFVNAGANVLLTSRDEKACAEAASSIQCQHYCTSNVSSRAGCEELAKHVGTVFDNQLHVLVNNAGTSWGEPLERVSGKANWGFDRVLDLVRYDAMRWSFCYPTQANRPKTIGCYSHLPASSRTSRMSRACII